MADEEDIIIQATMDRLNKMFNKISGSATSAATALNRVTSSANRIADQIGDVGTAYRQTGQRVKGAGSDARSAGDDFERAGKKASSFSHALNQLVTGQKEGAGSLFKSFATLTLGVTGGAAIFKALSSKISALSNVTGIFGRSLGLASRLVGGLVVRLGLIAPAALGLAIEQAEAFAESWRKASTVGAMFGGSMVNMEIQASNAYLSLKDFASVVTQNAEGFALFGGVTQAGVDQFTKLQSMLNSTTKGYREFGQEGRSFVEQLRSIGVTSEESAELIADLMGSQAMAAKMRRMTDQQQAEVTADYINSLNQLSILTGKQRATISEEMKQMSLDAQFRAATYDLTTYQQQAAQDLFAYAKTLGPGYADVLKSAIAGVPAVTEAGLMAQATSLGQVLADIGSKVGGAQEGDQLLEQGLSRLGIAANQTQRELQGIVAAGLGGQFDDLYMGAITQKEKIDAIFTQVGNIYGPQVAAQLESTNNVSAALKILSDYSMGVQRDVDGNITQIGTDYNRMVNELGVILDSIGSTLRQFFAYIGENVLPEVYGIIRGAGEFLPGTFGYDNPLNFNAERGGDTQSPNYTHVPLAESILNFFGENPNALPIASAGAAVAAGGLMYGGAKGVTKLGAATLNTGKNLIGGRQIGNVVDDAWLRSEEEIIKNTKSATDAARKAGEQTAESASKAAAKTSTTYAKTILKSLPKMLLKKLPLISILAGAGFAAGRYIQGDLEGAMLEMGSGLAGTFPVVGTAASVGADLLLVQHDVELAAQKAKKDLEALQNESKVLEGIRRTGTRTGYVQRTGEDSTTENTTPLNDQKDILKVLRLIELNTRNAIPLAKRTTDQLDSVSLLGSQYRDQEDILNQLGRTIDEDSLLKDSLIGWSTETPYIIRDALQGKIEDLDTKIAELTKNKFDPRVMVDNLVDNAAPLNIHELGQLDKLKLSKEKFEVNLRKEQAFLKDFWVSMDRSGGGFYRPGVEEAQKRVNERMIKAATQLIAPLDMNRVGTEQGPVNLRGMGQQNALVYNGKTVSEYLHSIDKKMGNGEHTAPFTSAPLMKKHPFKRGTGGGLTVEAEYKY